MSDTAGEKVIQAQTVVDQGDGTLLVMANGQQIVLDMRVAKLTAPAPGALDLDSGVGRLVQAVRAKRSARQSRLDEIESQVIEAGRTLGSDKMPGDVARLGKMNCALPEYVRTKDELVEAQRDRDDRKRGKTFTAQPPTSVQIDRLDQVLDWMLWTLAEFGEDGRLVFAGKLAGFGYRRIASVHPSYGSKDAVARAWKQIVEHILAHDDAATKELATSATDML